MVVINMQMGKLRNSVGSTSFFARGGRVGETSGCHGEHVFWSNTKITDETCI